MKLPRSFIKNIAIQLPHDYQLSNNPFVFNYSGKRSSKNDPCFIGRTEHIKKFKAFLQPGNKGVFLVTGYRGMGKTSFVNHVICQYIEELRKKEKTLDLQKKTKVIPIHLTLAQTNPKEFDLLRQMVNSISEKYNGKSLWNTFYKLVNLLLLLSAVSILIKIVIYKTLSSDDTAFFPDGFTYNFITFFILAVLSFAIFNGKIKNSNAVRLKSLLDRCHTSVTQEQGFESNLGMDFLGKFIAKKSKTYPIADNKLIEYELQIFLEQVNKQGQKFIFIFDELDKIDLQDIGFNHHEELDSFERRSQSQSHNLRNRKQAVLSIITGLKSFLTTAEARFIFIAGREMFDAALADIADKQSPLSSIFTYTFHIESLLKEEEGYTKEKNISSVSSAIQEFLKHQLFDKKRVYDYLDITPDKSVKKLPFRDIPLYNLVYTYFFKDKSIIRKDFKITKKARYIEQKHSPEEFIQVYFMLQALETYLIYRSSGSPKKLIKAFHEFVKMNKDLNENTDSLKSEKITVIKRQEYGESSNYLYFNYNDQYRIGFINSLYRPFIIQNGRSFKLFSENTIIAVPYLFDQIFKFHPFAFSMSNLEYIPELLTSGKTPSIRRDLKLVIDYLYQSHIRDTDIQLFAYKFRSKTTNEISYISRIYEEEAAAFNFTLDESHSIKAIIIEKIKELRSIYSKFHVDSEMLNPQIYSISNLNTHLGDLYFFDQEFDDAINSYSDAIRPINHISIERMNHRDFISLVRNKLKLGLCFEKTSSYEEALAFYSDSVQDIKRFFAYYLNNSDYLEFKERKNYKPDDHSFYTSSMNDLLQICVQSFLANLHIQEKMGLEGTTSSKARMEIREFLTITDHIGDKLLSKNHMIIANLMLHYGKLLYYKNSALLSKENTLDAADFYPPWYNNKRGLFNKYFDDNEKYSQREPLMAFWLYFMGLDEVMKSRKYFDKNTKDDFIYSGDTKVLIFHEYLNNLVALDNDLPGIEGMSGECFTAMHFKYMAGFLSSMGDSMLGMTDLKTEDISQGKKFKVLISNVFKDDSEIVPDSFLSSLRPHEGADFNLTDVFKCYYLAARFYEKYGRISSAVFQYRKIIYFLMIVAKEEEYSTVDPIFNLIEKTILNKAKQLIGHSNQHADRHMLIKAQQDFKHVFKDNAPEWNIENSLANSSDLKELDLIFAQFQFNIIGTESEIPPKLINPYLSISTQFLRITELDFFSKFLYKKIISDKTAVDNVGSAKDFETKKQDIFDYVYSKTTLIRILKIYETDYMLGSSYVAYVHITLAEILQLLFYNEKNEPITVATALEKCSKDFDTIFGDGSKTLLDIEYHLRMAKDFYKKAIELHTAGAEYRNQIKDMIFLEDDFNDNSYHFGAAIERYLMVNGFFAEQIKSIDDKLLELETKNNLINKK